MRPVESLTISSAQRTEHRPRSSDATPHGSQERGLINDKCHWRDVDNLTTDLRGRRPYLRT